MPQTTRPYPLRKPPVDTRPLAEQGPLYVGIDVHKKSLRFCVMQSDGRVLESYGADNRKDHARALVERYRGRQLVCGFEAGLTGYALAWWLREYGAECMIIAPCSIPRTEQERRVKTDRVDARRIADELRCGRCRSIVELGQQQLHDRQLHRTVEQLERERRRLMQQIKSCCTLHGIAGPWEERNDPSGLSRKDLAWLQSAPTAIGSLDYSLRVQAELFETLDQQIKALRAEIDRVIAANAQYKRLYDKLIAVPGIGPKTAQAFVLEVPPVELFDGPEAFVSWLGLTPSEHSSGDKVRRGGVTRRGHSGLRRLLVEVQWPVRKQNETLRTFYSQVCARANAQKAQVATARRLATWLFMMIRNDSAWNPPAGAQPTEEAAEALVEGSTGAAPDTAAEAAA